MRIASLLPSATEIVAALGRVDMLVGRSHECDYPAAVASLPPVTATAIDAGGAPGDVNAQVRALAHEGAPLYTVLADRLEALAPDVIVTQALCAVCAVSETDVRAIAARSPGPPRVVTLAASTFDGVVDDIAVVAEAIGAEADGVQLVASLRARLRAVHDRLAAARAPRPRDSSETRGFAPAVVVIEWTDPLFVAGHWVPEMIHRAGGRDVVGRAGAHSTVVTAEAIAAARPEVVLIAPCGYDVERSAAAARTVRVAPGAAVWAIDANALVSRPGPRLVDGVETMAAILHPALFPPAPAEWAIRIA